MNVLIQGTSIRLEILIAFIAVIIFALMRIIGACCEKHKVVEISLFGHKIDISMLLIMMAVYGLIVVSTIGGCCNEGFASNLADFAAGANTGNETIPSIFNKQTKFSPNCCPNTYSNSSGCYCANKK